MNIYLDTRDNKTYENAFNSANFEYPFKLVDNYFEHSNLVIILEVFEQKSLDKLFKIREISDERIVCIIDNYQFLEEILRFENTHILKINQLNEDVKILLSYIKNFYNKVPSFIEITSNYEKIIIDIKTILYCESLNHSVIIHTLNGKFKSKITLSEIQKRLNNKNFVQIHKSYIVNLHYVSNIKNNELLLLDKSNLPIGKKYSNTLRSALEIKV